MPYGHGVMLDMPERLDEILWEVTGTRGADVTKPGANSYSVAGKLPRAFLEHKNGGSQDYRRAISDHAVRVLPSRQNVVCDLKPAILGAPV